VMLLGEIDNEPWHVSCAEGDAGRDHESSQTLLVPARSQCKTSIKLQAYQVLADW